MSLRRRHKPGRRNPKRLSRKGRKGREGCEAEQLQITNYKLQITDCRLQITDCRLQNADYKGKKAGIGDVKFEGRRILTLLSARRLAGQFCFLRDFP
jgi:hypothetical protein